jgi:hypothetical protein
VVITDAEPDRLAPLTPPAPMGLRGVWVVAALCCASPPACCCADALERSFACPSENLSDLNSAKWTKADIYEGAHTSSQAVT